MASKRPDFTISFYRENMTFGVNFQRVPWGHLLISCNLKGWKSMAAATGTKSNIVTATGIDFHGYLVKDSKRATDFYKNTLGLVSTWEGEQGAEFELADGSTFGIWRMGDGSWHPSAGVFFAVPNLKEAVVRLRDHGINVLDDQPFESEVCHMIGVEDSEGNSFMLHQRKQKA
jgi:predicted enzyme related to lactoylglutathione lyase